LKCLFTLLTQHNDFKSKFLNILTIISSCEDNKYEILINKITLQYYEKDFLVYFTGSAEKLQCDDFLDSSEESLISFLMNFESSFDKKYCILLDPSLKGGM